MAFVGQAFKADTLASQMTAGATSGTLAAGNFANFTTDYLVLDYDNPTSREIILCNVTGTAISSATRGISPTSDVTHAAGAAVAYVFLPNHYTNGLGIIAEGDGYTSWVPTYGASGSMTFTSVTTNYAKYRQFGRWVDFQADFTGTIGGTPSTDVTFTLPVTASHTENAYGGRADTVGAFAFQSGSATVVNVRRYDSSVWVAGSRRIVVSGSYEAATAAGA